MDCATFREWLHAYLDGELDLVRGLEMERHTQDCSACLTEETSQRELRSRLAAADLRFRPSEALRARVREGLEQAGFAENLAPSHAPESLAVRPDAPDPSEARPTGSKPSATGSDQDRPPGTAPRPDRPARPVLAFLRFPRAAGVMAICSVILVTIVSQFALQARKRDSTLDGLARELADDHFRSLQASHLMDVVSTDQHTVKPWFAGKLDFSPPVRDLADLGFPLAGGRLDFVHRHPAAALVYRRHLHVINVLCWPERDGEPSGEGMYFGRYEGCNVLLWSYGGFRWGAASDLNEAELRQFARLLQAPR